MKRYFVIVEIRTNEPECCYDTYPAEYSDRATRWEAEIEMRRAMKDPHVVNAWIEEKEVTT